MLDFYFLFPGLIELVLVIYIYIVVLIVELMKSRLTFCFYFGDRVKLIFELKPRVQCVELIF